MVKMSEYLIDRRKCEVLAYFMLFVLCLLELNFMIIDYSFKSVSSLSWNMSISDIGMKNKGKSS